MFTERLLKRKCQAKFIVYRSQYLKNDRRYPYIETQIPNFVLILKKDSAYNAYNIKFFSLIFDYAIEKGRNR
jgi:hypothetical protein